MKVQKLREKVLRNLADNYRQNPRTVIKYGEDDAREFGVPLDLLDSVLEDLKDRGLIESLASNQGFYAWRITVDGLEAVEEDEDDDDGETEKLADRLEAALTGLHQAQEESKKSLAEKEEQQAALIAAVDKLKDGEDPPEELTKYVPLSTIEMLIQRAVVQLRGEFIAALEEIKG